MITSRSLHKSNIVFVFKAHDVAPPENHELAGLYRGKDAVGIQLVDDPLVRMKVLDVPAKGLQVAWESRRLRIEDMQARGPEEDAELAAQAFMVYEALVAPRKIVLDSFGFNFEVYYQTKDVIRIHDYFNEISGNPMEIGRGLMDFGWQWTVSGKDGLAADGYFLKVTAPLEFTMHHNAHFAAKGSLSRKDLEESFRRAFRETHATAEGLKI